MEKSSRSTTFKPKTPMRGDEKKPHIYKNISKQYIEIKIPVPWGQVSGKWWGKQTTRPILCIHKFHENCGTFDRLIPLLIDDLGFLSIDLPGHGYSSHIQRGNFYSDLLYLATIQQIKNYFSWDKVSLMGHSDGAALSYLYSLMYPRMCDFIIFLDGLFPNFESRREPFSKLATEINRLLEIGYCGDMANEANPITELKRGIYISSNMSIDLQNVHYILNRNIKPSSSSPQLFYHSKDSRLRFVCMRSFTLEECLEATRDIEFPMLLLKTRDSPNFMKVKDYNVIMTVLTKLGKLFQTVPVQGTHHVHLNEPERIATYINEFIKRNNRGDRTQEGMIFSCGDH